MTSTVVPVRIGDELLKRIDAAAGGGKRSEFIRAAVEAALVGKSHHSGSSDAEIVAKKSVARLVIGRPMSKPGCVVLVEPKVTVAVRPVSRWASDPRYGEFRDMVFRSGAVGVTASQVARETGWTLLLVERFAEAMGSAGEMHYPHGNGRMVGT